jgi:hypothetical protein
MKSRCKEEIKGWSEGPLFSEGGRKRVILLEGSQAAPARPTVHRCRINICKNSFRTSKRTLHFTITKVNWLMPFKEIIQVNTKPIHTKCRVTDWQSSWYAQLPLGFKSWSGNFLFRLKSVSNYFNKKSHFNNTTYIRLDCQLQRPFIDCWLLQRWWWWKATKTP